MHQKNCSPGHLVSDSEEMESETSEFDCDEFEEGVKELALQEHVLIGSAGRMTENFSMASWSHNMSKSRRRAK